MVHVRRALPLGRLRLLVFDLDGTLIDSRQDLCNSVNATLENFDLAPLSDDLIASYIGDGAGMLIRRALAIPGEVPESRRADELFDEAFPYFLDYYRAHKLDFTTVYPGVMASLDVLKVRQDGSPQAMAVLTNKPVGPARAICDGLGLSPYFFSVYGGDSFATKKPDPFGLETLMREADVQPEETLMVGDSDVDVRTARNAGVWTLGCSFGLSPESLAEAEPDVLVDGAAEWIAAVNRVSV
jgi:phosphoglycolate phosphatase